MTLSPDAMAVRSLVDMCASDALVLDRIVENVDGKGRAFDKEYFWYVLLGCLLTTQQHSTTGMPVPRFLEKQPFPLSLDSCRRSGNVEQLVFRTLTDFGGIRRTSRIAGEAKRNYEWLENEGWSKVERVRNLLMPLRECDPQGEHKAVEREAAHCVDDWFSGIGPKQSRNLLQWLGLTRYEIPLDSRVCTWVNGNLSFEIDDTKLGNLRYYEEMLDRIQALCAEAGVLPCVFDASAFDDDNKLLPAAAGKKSAKENGAKGTTAAGFVNGNGQVTIRNTGLAGTDHFQYVYQLVCSKCGHTYGANGSDIHDRKCPQCQGGSPGLGLE